MTELLIMVMALFEITDPAFGREAIRELDAIDQWQIETSTFGIRQAEPLDWILKHDVRECDLGRVE